MTNHPDWSGFDWDGARYDDPDLVPGDPYEVAILGKKMRDVAELIDSQARNLRNLVDGNGWDSDAGRAFQKKVGDTADLLQKAHTRYAAAAQALGSDMYAGNAWAPTLERLQNEARSALASGKAAHQDSSANQAKICNAPSNTSHADLQRLHTQQTECDTELRKWQKTLEGILDTRDSAAGQAAKAIRNAIDHDGLKNPSHHWWDGWQDLVAKIGHWAGVAAAALGVAALLLSWVPILGEVLAALAAVASVVALVCDTISALDGKGTWLDVAIDVVGVLSFGAGRVLGEGAKAAEGAAKGLAVIKDAEADVALLREAGMDSEAAWDLVSSLKSEGKVGEALADVAKGPDSLRPTLGTLLSKSLNPKVYLNAIKESGEGWSGFKNAFSLENGGQYFKDMVHGVTNPLADVANSSFKTMAVTANRAYLASQTLPLAAGWGNLAPAGEPSNPVTGPDLFSGLKSLPVVGAGGIPFVNGRWSTPPSG